LTRGNRLYRMLHRDFDPEIGRLNELLGLAPDERARLHAARHTATPRFERLIGEDRENLKTLELRARRTARAEPVPRVAVEPPAATPAPAADPAPLAALGSIVSTWFIAPVVFMFLLFDTGEIKRALLSMVPNRFFEPALAVLADLDRAVGAYVRGVFLECCVLGVTVALFMAVIGVPMRWAVAIGIGTGASNVVPYMGFVAALLGGLGYALMADEVHPLLPLVTAETFPLWVIGAVAFAELLKNVVYEPIVLGSAVHLHPLVVVLGVVGGAILFGPVGLLLAIPTITVVKAFVASTAHHLKAYELI
jgi:hypothetical protein